MVYSETQHWIACACGEKLQIADHSFDKDKKCTVCGYKEGDPGTVIPVTPSDLPDDNPAEKSRFPWWMWLIIVVAVVALVVVVIVVCIVKKNKTATNDEPVSETQPQDQQEKQE